MLEEIAENPAGWIAAGIVGVLSIVEVSKIKFNPWSMLLGWIGDKLLAGVKKELSEVKSKVTKLSQEVGEVRNDVGALRSEHREDEAIAARTRILRFSDEVYQQARHSKEYFDQILQDISLYKHYCEKHPDFRNDMTVIATERIEAVYKHCLECRDFL